MDSAALPRTSERRTSAEDIGVEIAVERLKDAIEDAKPLLEEHWREIAVYKDIPLEPDWGFYQMADNAGILRIYTVREERTRDMLGYAVFIVKAHAHYRGHKWALNDIVWLHPKYRQMNIGRALVREWERDLQALGVHVVHVNAKVQHPALAYLLNEEGYAPVEAGYEKRLN